MWCAHHTCSLAHQWCATILVCSGQSNFSVLQSGTYLAVVLYKIFAIWESTYSGVKVLLEYSVSRSIAYPTLHLHLLTPLWEIGSLFAFLVCCKCREQESWCKYTLHSTLCSGRSPVVWRLSSKISTNVLLLNFHYYYKHMRGNIREARYSQFLRMTSNSQPFISWTFPIV